MIKVLIAAGGTGGHLFPAKQLAEMLQGDDCEILFAGHQLKGSPFFDSERTPFVEITAHPLKKGFFSALWKGFWQAIRLIRQFQPSVVVGFGSYHTFPVLLAAAVCRKKLVLFEANCLLGKVNRLILPAAMKIALQFPLPLKKGVRVPLLPWKHEEKPRISSAAAREAFGLSPDLETILVFGGSQGAAFLNETAPMAIASCQRKVQVIHLTGSGMETAVRERYDRRQIPVCVKAFEKEMSLAYTAATIALCRSGAGTVAELIRFEVPALLIPYPYASEDHQRKNGEYLSKELSAARMILQQEATPERIAAELEAIFVEYNMRYTALARANKDFRSAIHLVDIVREVAR